MMNEINSLLLQSLKINLIIMMEEVIIVDVVNPVNKVTIAMSEQRDEIIFKAIGISFIYQFSNCSSSQLI
ncbi:unnamed protein product [Paramecium octaurelia]|uniref:Uncharacterized protein n=1 Tax=Paramecium octaurelia TaxID=43137 RepID=A0A8S1V505_PAROT|nr:unnamed protein product [Paramecium octaurelia]